MNASTFLKNLGINQPGIYDEDNCYVVDLNSSDEFFKIYSLLDKSDELYPDDNLTLMDETESYIVFDNDDFQITLIADLEGDIYTLNVKELK